MPSPTSSTRPTSVRVTWAWNCSISRWITEVISSALNFMRLPFDQSLAELFESVSDRGVVDVVADLDDQPPDQGGVDHEPDHGRGAEHALDLALLLGGVDDRLGVGAGDLGNVLFEDGPDGGIAGGLGGAHALRPPCPLVAVAGSSCTAESTRRRCSSAPSVLESTR